MENILPMKKIIMLLILGTTNLIGQTFTVASPDGHLMFAYCLENDNEAKGCLSYTLSYKNKAVVLKSRLGVVTSDLDDWTTGFTLADQKINLVDETWGRYTANAKR